MTKQDNALRGLILQFVPKDGSTIGNKALLEQLARSGTQLSEKDYWRVRDYLIDEGLLATGGRGGSVKLSGKIDKPPLTGKEMPENDETTEKPKKSFAKAKNGNKNGNGALSGNTRFEQTFKNIDDVLWKEQG